MRSFSARREFDHASEAERGVMLRSRNRALAIYGSQVVLAITVAADGVAKLAGADVMVQASQLFGRGGGDAHHVRRRGRRRRQSVPLVAVRSAQCCSPP
jgi:hypothetical protein